MAARVKAKAGPWLPAAAAAGLTLVFIVFKGEEMSGFLQLSHLGRSVLRPMARAMVFMVIGLTAAMLIEALGWTTRLARLAAPLTRRARLPRAAAASFATAVVSNPAANAMLSEALNRGGLSPRAVAVANLLNGSWPAFIVHLPTSVVVASSFAGRAGLAYTAIMFAAATLRLFGAACLGRLMLPRPEAAAGAEASGSPAAGKKFAEIWPDLGRRLGRRLKTLLSVAVPVYYLATLAAYLGFFAYIRDLAAARLPDFFLPAEAAALVVFSLAAEFASGFAAAGALIDNGALTTAEAAAALILGNIISTPIRVLRWQLAAFLGFFQLRLGLILIACNQLFRVLSLVVALFVFWRLFAS